MTEIMEIAPRTPAQNAALVREMDENLSEDDPVFGVALILCALADGPPANADEIRRRTGLTRPVVREVMARLRSGGVLQRDGLHVDWFDEESGGVSFWLDALVGAGLMERAASNAD